MKLLAAAVLAATAGSSPLPSLQQDAPPTILMSPEQAAQCEAEGGCGVVTRQFVQELQRRAFAAGAEQGKASCKAGTEI